MVLFYIPMNTSTHFISLARTYKQILHNFYFKKTYSLGKHLNKLRLHERNTLMLLSLGSHLDLSRLVRVNFSQVEQLINYPEYKKYLIPKAKGGYREIFAPSAKLKSVQKCLNYYLQAYYLIIKPAQVHGFVICPSYYESVSNIMSNAWPHVKKKEVLTIDLKDFFPSISASAIKNVFESEIFQYNSQLATALTLLLTYQGKLPTGAPTSPVISNFICLSLDHDLNHFCEEHGLTYTRYADDLTFSSMYSFTDDQVLDIINLIRGHGFRINEQKLRLKPWCRKQTVTGLTVNQRINVNRSFLKKTRAMLFDFTTNGLAEASRKHFKLALAPTEKQQTAFLKRLEGYIGFIGQVRGPFDGMYLKFQEDFILAKSSN